MHLGEHPEFKTGIYHSEEWDRPVSCSKSIPIYIQQDATLHSLFYLETVLHVSVGTSTVTATCRYSGR